MSLKNGVKTTSTVVKCTLDNDYIVTLVGQLNQTCVKTEIRFEINETTPGGKIIRELDSGHIEGLFDNQSGIRKEFYMGYSVCHPEDKNAYDMNLGVKYAKNNFSRPIVTYNFTYLNKDQIECLLRNEIDFIVNKKFNGAKIANYEVFNL